VKERSIVMCDRTVRALIARTKTQTRRLVKAAVPADQTARWTFCMSSTSRADEGKFSLSVLDPNGKRFTERGRERVLAELRCPYGKPGDRLYVRERWAVAARWDGTLPRDLPPNGLTVLYGAGGSATRTPAGWRHDPGPDERPEWAGRARNARFMPRWASRIDLELTQVRVQRLHDVSEDDAVAEGIGSQELPIASGPMFARTVNLPCRHCGQRRDRHFGSVRACGGEHGGHVWNPATARGGYAYLWEQLHGIGSWKDNPYVWALTFDVVHAPDFAKEAP
jgi:hypothetical protein